MKKIKSLQSCFCFLSREVRVGSGSGAQSHSSLRSDGCFLGWSPRQRVLFFAAHQRSKQASILPMLLLFENLCYLSTTSPQLHYPVGLVLRKTPLLVSRESVSPTAPVPRWAALLFHFEKVFINEFRISFLSLIYLRYSHIEASRLSMSS